MYNLRAMLKNLELVSNLTKIFEILNNINEAHIEISTSRYE